jgi:hypothetical protein
MRTPFGITRCSKCNQWVTIPFPPRPLLSRIAEAFGAVTQQPTKEEINAAIDTALAHHHCPTKRQRK